MALYILPCTECGHENEVDATTAETAWTCTNCDNSATSSLAVDENGNLIGNE